MRARTMLGVTAATALAVFGFARYREWHLGWGATADERGATMPGDELLPSAHFEPTRAITIDAPPEAVWPWIVQLGYGRAGWYSYDLLDNLGHGHSADRIVEELQDLSVGDWIPMGPTIDERTAFRVQLLDAPHAMVWRKPTSTWCWTLERLPADRTRLVTRIRVRYDWRSPAVVAELALMEIGDFWMMRKELLAIRERAEGHARARPAIDLRLEEEKADDDDGRGPRGDGVGEGRDVGAAGVR